jgi:hypothetical protein
MPGDSAVRPAEAKGPFLSVFIRVHLWLILSPLSRSPGDTCQFAAMAGDFANRSMLDRDAGTSKWACLNRHINFIKESFFS